MHKIIRELIKKINLTNDLHNEIASNAKDDFESFNFSIDEFKNLDNKIRSDTRMRSSNIYRAHLRFDDDDDNLGILASSTKQFIGESADDNIQEFNLEYNKETSKEHFEKKISI